ncbi:hypothetical protein Pan258_29550 [Symmachiella dynata]|uniref:AbiJ-related protein n=1 Tax=Symmachiella dynata TaxID=2527995 RepID=UPI00118C3192|nr:hypothetical protein [Symmachiella dynata]QDT48908.1 hypothetical protein Pan258_29550 [Symmachiella dynata]
MAGLGELVDDIAEVLWANISAPQLPAVCRRFGMDIGEESEAYGSKRSYVRKRITAWNRDQLVELAQKVEDTYPSESLQRLIELFVPDHVPQVSVITRQHLLADLVSLGPLEGKLDLLDFLGRMWKLETEPPSGTDFRCTTLKDEIFQHMVRNDDYSYSDMLELVGVPGMSNKRFIEFLEWTVHPLVRVDDEQQRFVTSINSHLKQDGLRLVATDHLSGFPVFRVNQIIDGVGGAAKNLIFASTGPKPEIVFSDAVNNDIKIVKNAEHCLVYDHPFSKEGLLWKHLTTWWAASTGCIEISVEVERTFYKRLLKSLQSPPEKLFFETYFERFRSQLGERLPALIPQVYLHYDPYTSKALQGNKRIPRQRMDFLLLLSPLERVVIEIDGSQHYSQDGQASPSKYAEMVIADRDLRLAGYEVYRFGGAELSSKNACKTLVESFFIRLFEKHDIRPLDQRTGKTQSSKD